MRGIVTASVIIVVVLALVACAWVGLIYHDARRDFLADDAEHDTHRGLGKVIYDLMVRTMTNRADFLRRRRIRREQRRG